MKVRITIEAQVLATQTDGSEVTAIQVKLINGFGDPVLWLNAADIEIDPKPLGETYAP